MPTINGYDLDDFGFRLGAADGHLDGPPIELITVQVAGESGERVTDRIAGAGSLTLRGWVSGVTSLAARTNWDRLFWALGQESPARIVLPDRPDRYYTAEYTGPAGRENAGPSLGMRQLPVTLPFRLLQPYRLAVQETFIGDIGTSWVTLPQGSADVAPLWVVAGPASGPLIEVQDAAEQIRAAMQWGVELDAGEFLVIDSRTWRTWVNTTGTPNTGTRVLDALIAGDWIQIDRRWSNLAPATPVYPRARCSSGTMTARYRRAWRI